MTKFQLVLLLLFGAAIIGGLLTFAVYKGRGSQQESIPVTIWGTLDGNLVNSYIQKIDGADTSIAYVQKRPETFDADFVNALALSNGPDAILVSQDQLFKHLNKVVAIPYDSYPQANYKNFIQESEVYLQSTGGLGIPFTVDPLVMFWNRDIFNNAAIALPPTTWDQFSTIAPVLTTKNQTGNINQSTVGLGEGSNIANAKEILSTLIMQAGNPITSYNGQDILVTLGQSIGTDSTNQFSPAESAIQFFTQFSNPTSQAYTWNKSLQDSKTYFLSNKLGVYFGYSTELSDIQNKNPNLNFDVALIPQIKSSTVLTNPLKVTYGKMYAFSITIGTKNTANTFAAISKLTDAASLKTWSDVTGMPAVRRDQLAINSPDAHASVFATSALWARGWIDPDTIQSQKIFKTMIDQVTSGQSTPSTAVNLAQNQLESLIRR